MKNRVSILIAGALGLAANGVLAGQETWFEKWHQAKFGRPTPAVEAQLRAEQQNMAFREDLSAQPASAWFEQWHKAKFGRSTPAEETRARAERENSANREDLSAQAPSVNWSEQYQRAKFGRIVGK
jgi:hypothetical protein